MTIAQKMLKFGTFILDWDGFWQIWSGNFENFDSCPWPYCGKTKSNMVAILNFWPLKCQKSQFAKCQTKFGRNPPKNKWRGQQMYQIAACTKIQMYQIAACLKNFENFDFCPFYGPKKSNMAAAGNFDFLTFFALKMVKNHNLPNCANLAETLPRTNVRHFDMFGRVFLSRR